jgi:BirA family transcriptional regulator, biotin operon repressor / biotin---[acetyl-CoA-carboxylase] ligase
MTEEQINLELLRERLAGFPIPEIRYFDVTGSTNDDAMKWISHGALDGSLIVADEQTAGRGRFQRKWVTRKGTSLAFSLIFHPETNTNLPLYAPLGALGVALAIEELYPAHPQIKWPNDVLLNHKKVCGILTEASWQETRLEGVVLGIGINIASSAIRAEDEFIFPASTLQSHLEKPVNRLDLLAEIIRFIFIWRQQLDSVDFIQAWNERLAFRGETVHINRPGQEILTGTIMHISQDGLLWIRQKDGKEISVSAGDVSLKKENPKPGE